MKGNMETLSTAHANELAKILSGIFEDCDDDLIQGIFQKMESSKANKNPSIAVFVQALENQVLKDFYPNRPELVDRLGRELKPGMSVAFINEDFTISLGEIESIGQFPPYLKLKGDQLYEFDANSIVIIDHNDYISYLLKK